MTLTPFLAHQRVLCSLAGKGGGGGEFRHNIGMGGGGGGGGGGILLQYWDRGLKLENL